MEPFGTRHCLISSSGFFVRLSGEALGPRRRVAVELARGSRQRLTACIMIRCAINV